jgi:hypothetical protein
MKTYVRRLKEKIGKLPVRQITKARLVEYLWRLSQADQEPAHWDVVRGNPDRHRRRSECATAKTQDSQEVARHTFDRLQPRRLARAHRAKPDYRLETEGAQEEDQTREA